jgi:hypothetical protein
VDLYDIIRELVTGREGTRAAEIHAAIDLHQAEHDKAAGKQPKAAPTLTDKKE